LGRAAALAAAVLLLVAAPAQAIPLYFTGPGGWGVDDAGKDAAVAAGLRIFDQAPYQLNGELDVVTPDPITIDTKATGGPGDPATGTTTWPVTNLTLQDPDDKDLWLVFFSGGMNDPNYPPDFAPALTPAMVGLEVSDPSGPGVLAQGDWALFHTTSGQTDYYYPGVYLGDLAIGETAGAEINYRVLHDLALVGGNYMYPQMSIGGVNAIPEPTALFVFAAGLVSFAATRRLRC
jgi:hypothetical protein